MIKAQLEATMKEKLQTSFHPSFIALENESHQHKAMSEHSHYKLTMVSDRFEKVSLIKRHRLVYQLLAEELSHSIHALSLHLYTPLEWDNSHSASPVSPQCKGGLLKEKEIGLIEESDRHPKNRRA